MPFAYLAPQRNPSSSRGVKALVPDGRNSEADGAMHDGLDFKKLDNVPPVSDPSWQPLTAALHLYVGEADRSIDEIVAWGRSQGHTGTLIRHMLAWLSFQDNVHYVPSQSLWRVGPEPKETFVGSVLDSLSATI